MDDVCAVMDAAGSSRAALLGLMDGGPLAILFAATHPERCLGLVLFGTSPRTLWAPEYPWGESREDAEREAHEIERDWGTIEDALSTADHLFPGATDRDSLAASFARFQRNSASPRGAADFWRMMIDIDVRPLLGTLQVPVLVLSRERMDDAYRESARFLVDRIAGARLFETPGTGNGLYGDGFGEMVDEIARFLDAAASRTALGPERVLASVLFTDIVDSTVKAVELGDRAWRDLVAEHHALVRRELQRFRGRELDTAGDGFFATFDGPARAIRCACAVRDAVAPLGLDARAGVHTGECEQAEGKVAGVAVVTGARIASLATPGEVLVSATVRDLVAGSGLVFEDRGVHTLKGLPEQRRVYAVVDAPA